MNKILSISVAVILGVLLLFVLNPASNGIKQRLVSVIGIGSGNKYCDASKTTLGEFSKNLQSKLHNNNEALSYYEYSGDCFSPEDIKMDEDSKQKFFCEDNPDLKYKYDNVKSYCS